MSKIQNKGVKRASFATYYVVISAISMFIYGIVAATLHLPWEPVLIPPALVLLLFIGNLVIKNFRLIWMYITDQRRGRLMIRLNDYSAFEQEHKWRVVKWVYPNRRQTRNERKLELQNSVMNGGELNKYEKRELKRKTVFCPQQLLDGINKAFLVSNLIWAHEYVYFLDDEIREILGLTDEHIDKFDINTEIKRCKTKAHKKEYDRYVEIANKKGMYDTN